jgi:hypothetical protein
MTADLERIWKEAFSGGSEKDNKSFIQYSWCLVAAFRHSNLLNTSLYSLTVTSTCFVQVTVKYHVELD